MNRQEFFVGDVVKYRFRDSTRECVILDAFYSYTWEDREPEPNMDDEDLDWFYVLGGGKQVICTSKGYTWEITLIRRINLVQTKGIKKITL